MEDKLYFLASDISVSEEQRESSDIFLFVKMRILDTLPNGNGEGVTEAFIDEVVANPDKYACLALYADLDQLMPCNYEKLGHRFDAETGKFFTKQVGAITNFEKVHDEFGCSLIGEARIPKREAEICERIMELYSLGNLNFSFEIRYIKEATIEENGVIFVDANENNALTGVAIVSVPAYPESTALQMVAEANEATNEVNKMTLEEALALIAQKDEELANKDQMIAEKDATIVERDQKIDELTNALAAKKDEESACAEEEDGKEEDPEKKDETATAEAQTATASWELQEKEREINDLRTQIAALTAMKEELEAIKAEMAQKELEANQAMAKAFAEKQGLNAEDENVAKAIAELDYKMIAELSMANETEEVPAQNVATASLVGDGFEIKNGKYDDLLAPAKN